MSRKATGTCLLVIGFAILMSACSGLGNSGSPSAAVADSAGALVKGVLGAALFFWGWVLVMTDKEK